MQTLKPSIRFKGFTDDWEQRKLGDIVNVYSGKDYKNLSEGDIPVYGTGGYMLSVNEALSYNEDAIGIGRKGTIDKPYILRAPFWTVDTLFYAIPNKKIDLNYTYDIFQNIDWEKKDESTGVPSLSKIAIDNVDIFITSYAEQQKIGLLFEQTDKLITLYKQKYEKLTTIKKSLLAKMFPAESETVPQIRFKGFTEPWQKRKVTELGKIYIGLVTTMTKHYTNSGTLLIRNSDIKDGRFEFGDTPIYLEQSFAESNSSRMHQIGDVITVHTGDVGTSAVIGEKEANSIGFATIVTRPNSRIINSDYLSLFLNTDIHKRWAVSISTGDGRTNYNLGDYYELIVPVPMIEEQKKISAFIKNINRLITLYQRKLDKLQTLKNSLLNKMFV